VPLPVHEVFAAVHAAEMAPVAERFFRRVIVIVGIGLGGSPVKCVQIPRIAVTVQAASGAKEATAVSDKELGSPVRMDFSVAQAALLSTVELSRKWKLRPSKYLSPASFVSSQSVSW
jgi:hypothetical protein